MEGGSGEGGGKREKESTSIFCFISHLFLLSFPVLVVVSCALHWLFVDVQLQGDAYCGIYKHKAVLCMSGLFYLLWFDYREE